MAQYLGGPVSRLPSPCAPESSFCCSAPFGTRYGRCLVHWHLEKWKTRILVDQKTSDLYLACSSKKGKKRIRVDPMPHDTPCIVHCSLTFWFIYVHVRVTILNTCVATIAKAHKAPFSPSTTISRERFRCCPSMYTEEKLHTICSASMRWRRFKSNSAVNLRETTSSSPLPLTGPLSKLDVPRSSPATADEKC